MDFASQIVEAPLQEMFARWEDKAIGGSVPCRTDFDPLSLPAEMLPFVFILERHAERFFCRLAGTGIRALLGFETSQRYLDDLIPHTHSITRGAVYARVIDEQIPAYFSGPLSMGGQGERPVSCLLLPVAAQGGAADQVFGVLVARASNARPATGWVGPDGASVVAWAA